MLVNTLGEFGGQEIKLKARSIVRFIAVPATAVALMMFGLPAAQAVETMQSATQDTLQSKITSATQTITLDKDYTEDITIETGKTVTLDLNGHKLTNKTGHTITNKGTLTIKDSAGNGTVDNVTHTKAALVNSEKATVTIEGGTFTRSKETYSSSGEKNSYYVIDNNKGTLTINGGTVTNTSNFSSLIRNLEGTLTVNGGTLYNKSFIALKNDDYGTMKINGGTITSPEQALQNWSNATINGGTLNGKVFTWAYTDKGKNFDSQTTINGGTINGNVGVVPYGTTTAMPAATITGGTINGTVKKYTYNSGAIPVDATAEGSSITISGGTFSEAPDSAFIDPDSGLQPNEDGTYGIATPELTVADFTITIAEDSEGLTVEEILSKASAAMNVEGYTLTVDEAQLETFNAEVAKAVVARKEGTAYAGYTADLTITATKNARTVGAAVFTKTVKATVPAVEAVKTTQSETSNNTSNTGHRTLAATGLSLVPSVMTAVMLLALASSGLIYKRVRSK